MYKMRVLFCPYHTQKRIFHPSVLNFYSTLTPDDGLSLSDFINGEVAVSSASSNVLSEQRTRDGRLRLPPWLKRNNVSNEANENFIRLKKAFSDFKS